MSNGRRIVLHIGLPKTGTTTIQSVLYANRELLLAQEGVLYPSLAPNLSTALWTIFGEDPRGAIVNKMAGFTTEEIAAYREQYRESLESEILSREWDVLLLSAEGVSNLSAAEIAKLREWGEQYSSDWTVLICVRHPLAHVRSLIPQLLKRGDTLQQLYELPPLPGFRSKICNAMHVFGRERVRVFDFDTAANSDGGVVGTFAEQVGLSAPSCEFLASQELRENESLSSEAVHILDSLNRQRPMFVDGARASRRSEHEFNYLRRIKGRRFDLPGSVKDEIRLRSRKDVAWLNETFGLDLYHDVANFTPHAKSREEPVEALSVPAVDGIAEVFGELMTATVYRRLLDQGEAALARGKLERAAGKFREAARLDPDAPQPKELLEEVAAKTSQALAARKKQLPRLRSLLSGVARTARRRGKAHPLDKVARGFASVYNRLLKV